MGGMQAYLKDRKFQEAIDDFTAAIEIIPNHMHAYIERCEAYRMLGEWDKVRGKLVRIWGLGFKAEPKISPKP